MFQMLYEERGRRRRPPTKRRNARNLRPFGHNAPPIAYPSVMSNLAECRTKAAEFESRAARTTDWQLKATFKDLARFYRQLAKYLEESCPNSQETK